MNDHQHEPDVSTLRSINGAPADPLDPDSYPLLSLCQECKRWVRAEGPRGPWQTAEAHAGAKGIAHEPVRDDEGGTKIWMHKVASPSGAWHWDGETRSK